MKRLTEWILRRRLLVAVVWLLVAGAGGATASTTVDRLGDDFALPGQPAYEANQQIVEQYGSGGANDPLLLVVQGDLARACEADVAAAAEAAVPGSRVVAPSDDGADLLSPSVDLVTIVVYPPLAPGPEPYAAATPALEQVAERLSTAGSRVSLTGFTMLTEDGEDDRGLLVGVLLGGTGALVVLALVLGSLLAGVPLLVAAVSILATFLALLGLTLLTEVSFVVPFLVALIGLGVAIDYSLLVVTRWREEAALGASNDDAVRRAMDTAGRSVLLRGFTVAVPLAALVLVPVPFLRSIGLGGLLIPLLSVATSLTLVPALLSALGPRLTWPRRGPAVTRSRTWAAVARGVLRHRWLSIAGCVVVLAVLSLPALRLTLGTPQLSGLTGSTPASSAAVTSATSATTAATAATAVEAGVPTGVLRPTEVLVPAAGVATTLERLAGVDGVAAAVAPPGAAWRAGGRSLLQVWSTEDPSSVAGRAALDGVRDVATGGVAVGGSPAEDADLVTAVYRNATWVGLGVALGTFLLLARALRSLWLPVKALALTVLSLAAACGVTVLIWQDGYGSDLLFGQQSTGVITTWVPVAAFSFLFGLSMHDEVLILTRTREDYDQHGETERAVVDGIAHTGRLVTSAALILFLALVALSTVPAVEVKILATTLALGIVIDAVVVRGLLGPAVVGVLGRASWTIPRLLSVLLRVRGPAGAAPGPGRHRA